MKVVAMIDSFKGSATSAELNQAALAGFSEEWTKVSIPIADGGEGTMAAIYAEHGGVYRTVHCHGPLGEPRTAEYLRTKIHGEACAVIESAAIIGIHLFSPTDETVRQASSFGLGEVILDALQTEVKKIYLTLGGSGTSDGGLGLLQALGAKLSGYTNGNPLLSTNHVNLDTLVPQLQTSELLVLADVTNPYTGKSGFAEVFGPQKGAQPETVAEMDQKANRLAREFQQQYHLNLNEISGTGAAGGLGGAIALIGGKILPGFSTISRILDIETKMQEADLIITGEGKMDQQTAQGKVPFGVAQIAQKFAIPVVALCGSRSANIGVMASMLLGAFSIQQGPISLEEAMGNERTRQNMTVTAHEIARVFKGENK